MLLRLLWKLENFGRNLWERNGKNIKNVGKSVCVIFGLCSYPYFVAAKTIPELGNRVFLDIAMITFTQSLKTKKKS